MFREMIAAFSENRTKHTNALFEQISELLVVSRLEPKLV
jgi:hypothetical protein